MSAPIPLPEPVKRIARRARATPAVNRPVTRAIKTLSPLLPRTASRWLQDHFPRVGRATAVLPGGGGSFCRPANPNFS